MSNKKIGAFTSDANAKARKACSTRKQIGGTCC